MKNLVILSVMALISFTQCSSPSPELLCNNEAMRAKTISILMNNTAYMAQVMDSMQVKHHAAMAKNDMAMNAEMMDKMMAMCNTDSSMCR